VVHVCAPERSLGRLSRRLVLGLRGRGRGRGFSARDLHHAIVQHVIEAPWLVNGGHGASLKRWHRLPVRRRCTAASSCVSSACTCTRTARLRYIGAPTSQLSASTKSLHTRRERERERERKTDREREWTHASHNFAQALSCSAPSSSPAYRSSPVSRRLSLPLYWRPAPPPGLCAAQACRRPSC
jgi:hypothetical protein